MRALFSAFGLGALLFLVPATANAETAVAGTSASTASATTQSQVFSALQELENSMLGTLVWSTPINGSKCKPTFSVGLFTLSLVYAQSDTCPLVGKVAIGLLPLSADVDLDVNNMSAVNRIQFKASISVKYSVTAGMSLQLYFTDGQISIKPGSTAAWSNLSLNGSTAMSFTKTSYSITGRKNIFETSTGNGFSLITQLTQSPPVRRFQGCLLTGGVASDVNAGTLTSCTTLFQ